MTTKVYMTEIVYSSLNEYGDLEDTNSRPFLFKTQEEANQAKTLAEEHYKKLKYDCIVAVHCFDLDKLTTIDKFKEELASDSILFGDGEDE